MKRTEEEETLEEIIDVLNQMKSIFKLIHLGEIPEGDLEDDFWTELELSLSEIVGTLTNNKTDSINKEYVDFLVSARLKNLNNLSEKINLENYPQMRLNFLLVSYSIKLLDTYYNIILKKGVNQENNSL